MTAGPDKPTDHLASGPGSHGVLIEQVRAALRPRYEVEREIGRGGTAFVYLARDLRDERLVALKVLRPELVAPSGEERFQREIEIVRGLTHQNILPLLDFGAFDGRHFFTMPFVEGDTLRRRIKRERQLKLEDALTIAQGVARGLDHAHSMGIVHRDVKPANILLEGDNVLVADFGIARTMVVRSGDEITPNSGIAIGTVEYMSPEQGEGRRELDARSDVYAMGCVVYEMLAGEPPFSGATAQAVVARHCHEQPRSIRVIRPSIPLGVQRAVERALAKVPADRFDTCGEFIDALVEGAELRTDIFGFTRLTRRSRTALALALGGVVIASGLIWSRVRQPPLDHNRVVVFPLHDSDSSAADGENFATFVGYELEGTEPLSWRDGWELLGSRHRSGGQRLTSVEARRLSRRDGAGFFIDGSILRRRDSLTVVLKLHGVAVDSVLRTVGWSAGASNADLQRLGTSAVAELLPALVAPGGRMEVGAFSDRSTKALANFFLGEREYRRMRFRAALPHYQAALREDSAFGLAALRGAYAATWLSAADAGLALAQVAIRLRANLRVGHALLARGLAAYLVGRPDSAVARVQAALRTDPSIHGGWTLLGEIYARALPSEPAADSLSRDALAKARADDPDFAPTLLLLEEIALRDGDVAATMRLRRELAAAGADTTHEVSRAIMLKCVQGGPSGIDWPAAIRRDETAVLSSGKILGGRAAQPACGAAAFRSLLETAGTTIDSRYVAFLGLLGLLAATNQPEAAAAVRGWTGVSDLPLKTPVLVVAASGFAFAAEAATIAEAASGLYDRLPSDALWALGLWEFRTGNHDRLQRIASELRKRATAGTATRRDRLIASAAMARERLATGDTAAALSNLLNLAPSGQRQAIAWDPSESLGAERILLAEILQARGAEGEAMRVAAMLDATEPIVYPLYLRQSLQLRERIARSQGDARREAEMAARLKALNRF